MPNFDIVIRNLTRLRKLHFDYVQVNLDATTLSSLTNLSSLTALTLSACNIFGPLPVWIWNISQEIGLSRNRFTGGLPLMVDISKLLQLTTLDLSINLLDGKVPSWLFNLPSLNKLDLAGNQFFGQLTVSEDVSSSLSLTNLSSLMSLSLTSCHFFILLPAWIWNITQEIFLSRNQFTGELPSMVNISKLSQLTVLDLSKNLLDKEIPSWLFSLPSLNMLYLADNKFFGQLTISEDVAGNRTTLLEYINLSDNKIQGSIPNSIFELVSLVALLLSSNNLSGIIEFGTFYKLKNLTYLNLSHNRLSLLTKSSSAISSNVAAYPRLHVLECSSCNITEFPDFLRTQEDLVGLNLSNNKIHGDIPKWAQNIDKDSVNYLNLSCNFLSGSLDLLQWKYLMIIDLHSNIEIPRCFKNFGGELHVLNLRSNKLNGTLPSSFGKFSRLEILDLNGNQLEGHLPPSLLRYQGLEVLDVGNNNFKGTFPYWLRSLPKLQVLILHSNNFHDNLGASKAKHPFSKLHILDLSNDGFNGTLPGSLLHSFKAMMNSNETRGEIPGVIRDLVSLRWLNLAHNNFTGCIPPFLVSLSELESLDLSSYMLEGWILRELASLTFLEFFNVSRNRLVGPIPQGQQFDTFQNNSYLENLGLCGNPLSKKCGEEEEPSDALPRMDQNNNDTEYKGAFGWVMVVIGYGCGTLVDALALVQTLAELLRVRPFHASVGTLTLGELLFLH
ncbi:hypothetical protein Nepgr_016373 [Nepenthes gracilis]|uniref:Receptor-like protein 12 n=1 Tax=Nepenthes gracilis TaxID=150966 RepID=A0AAD3XR92_NEPGR|nr:hypothetical protein Nepgr_016373 [Nepenthes gracilis]